MTYTRKQFEEDFVLAHLKSVSPEKILRQYSPEDRLRDLAPEDRLRDLAPEQLLKGLSPEQLTQIKTLLDQKTKQ